MNGKQTAILICGLAASALILWHDLPVEFPWISFKVFMLFLKLFAVLALAVFAYVFAAGKKGSSDR
ncbi:MAG: hypothetical protein MUE70_16820 [Desulfobacterales bacterium]|jgi:hypothetical protein|nr:hypothetical protein [Desulfobacterales bacterium]